MTEPAMPPEVAPGEDVEQAAALDVTLPVPYAQDPPDGEPAAQAYAQDDPTWVPPEES